MNIRKAPPRRPAISRLALGRKERSASGRLPISRSTRSLPGYSRRLASAPWRQITSSIQGRSWPRSSARPLSLRNGYSLRSATSHSTSALCSAASHSPRTCSISARWVADRASPPPTFSATPALISRSRAARISSSSSSIFQRSLMKSRAASRLVKPPSLVWQAARSRSSWTISMLAPPLSNGRYWARLRSARSSSRNAAWPVSPRCLILISSAIFSSIQSAKARPDRERGTLDPAPVEMVELGLKPSAERHQLPRPRACDLMPISDAHGSVLSTSPNKKRGISGAFCRSG